MKRWCFSPRVESSLELERPSVGFAPLSRTNANDVLNPPGRSQRVHHSRALRVGCKHDPGKMVTHDFASTAAGRANRARGTWLGGCGCKCTKPFECRTLFPLGSQL